MKKAVFVLVLLAVAAVAFGQRFAAGGGTVFDANFLNGVYFKPAQAGEFGREYFAGQQVMAPGGFLFFDARYAAVEVSVSHGWITAVTNATATGDLEGVAQGGALSVGISALGKLPFSTGSTVTLFPMLGIHYNRVVLGTGDLADAHFTEIADFSQVGLLGGLGGDFTLSGPVFVRAEALFHFRFPSRYFRDYRRVLAEEGPARTTFGMGPRLKVGVGYRFGHN